MAGTTDPAQLEARQKQPRRKVEGDIPTDHGGARKGKDSKITGCTRGGESREGDAAVLKRERDARSIRTGNYQRRDGSSKGGRDRDKDKAG